MVALSARPSIWTRALSRLIPPAEAKGSEPSATLSAWLSSDRSQLLVTGVANDAWQDSVTQVLHTSTRPLGLTVIDTATFAVVASLDLPVTRGVSTADAIALAGTTDNLSFCDQVCNPDNNEPDVEGEALHSGVYLLDPATLEVRSHHRPGANFYMLEGFEEWLVLESFGADGDYVESVDLTTATPSARKEFGSSSFVVTDRGVLGARLLD